MDREEMIRILEEIIRDDATNLTARCTAIRTLLEFPQPPVVDPDLYPADFQIRRKGRIANNS